MTKNDQQKSLSPANFLDWLITLWIGLILGYTTWGLGGYLPFAQTMITVTWMMVVLVVLHALWIILNHRQRPRIKWLPVIFIPCFAWMLASLFFVTAFPWLAEREIWMTAQALLILWITVHNVRRRPQMWFLIILVLTVGFLACLSAFYQHFIDPEWLPMGREKLTQYEGRASGVFGIPNSLAAMLVLQLPFLLSFALCRRFGYGVRIFSIILALVFLAALVLTGSRGGWLGALTFLLLLPFFLLDSWKKKLAAFLSLIVILAFSGGALYMSVDIFKTRINHAIKDRGEHTRPVMWKAAWSNFQDHPWKGSGLDSYKYQFDKYAPDNFSLRPIYVHSDYLQTLSDLGAVGFVLLYLPVGIILILFWNYWRSLPILARPKGKNEKIMPASKMMLGAILMAIAGFAVHLLVDFHTHIPALLFNVMIWLGLGIKIIAARNRQFPGQNTPPVVIALAMVGMSLILSFRAIPYLKARNEIFWGDDGVKKLLADFEARTETPEYLDQICRHYEKALQWDNRQADAWAGLGYANILYYYVYPDERIQWAQKGSDYLTHALEISEASWKFWSYYGYSFTIAEYPPEVTEIYYKKAIEIAPGQPNAWYFYALFLKKYPERQNEALQAVEKVLKLDPQHKSAIKLRSKLILP